MRRICVLVVLLMLFISVNAQRKISKTRFFEKPVLSHSPQRTVTDTLFGNWETGGTPALNTTVEGGYVIGNNGYGDLQKAEAFINSVGPIGVEGAIIWFGAKERDATANPMSEIQVIMYALDGAGTNNTGPVMIAPGTQLALTDVFYPDIDTSMLQTVLFSSPVYTASNFAIGINFSLLAPGDTVGVVHSTDGDAGGFDLSWEQWDDFSWNSILYAWPLDIDIFIWALYDGTATGVNETGFVNGGKLLQNAPNPSTGFTNISYELEKGADNVSVMILDATGKQVAYYSEGTKGPGKYSIPVNASAFAPGVYYYALTAGDCRIAQKMVVE